MHGTASRAHLGRGRGSALSRVLRVSGVELGLIVRRGRVGGRGGGERHTLHDPIDLTIVRVANGEGVCVTVKIVTKHAVEMFIIALLVTVYRVLDFDSYLFLSIIPISWIILVTLMGVVMWWRGTVRLTRSQRLGLAERAAPARRLDVGMLSLAERAAPARRLDVGMLRR